MKLKQYQIDAFAERVFEGNPAAVCPLDRWLDDALLQRLAEENNLSETAYFVPTGDGFALRWFTPVREVDLCGHATLACAHVLFDILHYTGDDVRFTTRSGDLFVRRGADALLIMDFPASVPRPCAPPAALIDGLRRQPLEVLAAEDYIAVLDSEEAVRAVTPDQTRLAELDRRGVIVTARGREVDFVSRFFGPKYGIPEDPVTGSAHCALTPYWSQRLGRNVLRARQVSSRGGNVQCELKGDRVLLSGRAVTFMEALIDLGDTPSV